MSALARLCLEHGCTVTGCDQADSAALRAVAAAGATALVGHDPAHLASADTVVVSSAIQPDQAELRQAADSGLPIVHRSVVLAALMSGQVVSIAGTHGKTTTTAMTVAALRAAGADPSFVLGGSFADTGQSAHAGRDDIFVVEADESDGSFRQYPTNLAVITGIEADHLDNWGTVKAYRHGFRQFAGAAGVGCLVANGDDPVAARLAGGLRQAGRDVMTFGQSATCDLVISAIDLAGPTAGARFEYADWSRSIDLRLPGRHNLFNAAAAWLVGQHLGFDRERLAEGLAGFSGTARRFQTVGTARGVTVVDDYAHHPTELAATIAAAREVAGAGRVIVAFQPHLYSRTRDFADGFGQALAMADQAIVLDIFAAREEPIAGVSANLIVAATRRHGGTVFYVPDLGDVPVMVAGLARPNDLVLTAGAGSITTAGPAILARLESS